MGSRQSSCACPCEGEPNNEEEQCLDFLSLDEYTLADLKLFRVIGIQIGINQPIDNDSILETQYDPNTADCSAPPLIHISQGISGALPDVDGVGEKNYVHCFSFLEVEELEESKKGIIIEFGEYAYGHPNDFNDKTFYPSKNGGLRLYVVQENSFDDYCHLARIKCTIKKNEILDDILIGISREHKWRKDFYNRKTQNCIDFVAVLLNYLQILNFEICKGKRNEIPDKILSALTFNRN